MTQQHYVPRANELVVQWESDFDMDELMSFEVEGGKRAEITRRAFEFFFAPVNTTTAEITGAIE